MPLFFLHFTMYDKARKHPLGGRVGLTYCLYMQLVGVGVGLLMTGWSFLQHYANQRGSAWAEWTPWGVGEFVGMFLKGMLILAPIMLLLSLLPYRYVKREMEKPEGKDEPKGSRK